LLVLDFSRVLAGPYCTMQLADLGARVIKIEQPGRGDDTRAWGPPFVGAESAYFLSVNRNKESLALDLKHPRARPIVEALLARADVVVENFRPGTMARLSLGYEEIAARHPRIVYCSISGFGQDGPYRDRAALDLVVQAESGMISVTGEPGTQGARCGVSIADIGSGMFAAFGIMTALHARGRTGRGQFVDVSMLEGQLSILQTLISVYLADGRVPRPMGTAYGFLLPYQTFHTKTRDIAIGIGSDKLWKAFCPLMGLGHLTDDPRYSTNAARVENRPSLVATLQDAFLTRTYEEWESVLDAAGIPVGAINTLEQVVKHPQVAARGALASCDHPIAGALKVVGPPVRLSETPGAIRSPAPLLGQHTDEVLRTHLGLEDTAIDELRRAGAIGSHSHR